MFQEDILKTGDFSSKINLYFKVFLMIVCIDYNIWRDNPGSELIESLPWVEILILQNRAPDMDSNIRSAPATPPSLAANQRWEK